MLHNRQKEQNRYPDFRVFQQLQTLHQQQIFESDLCCKNLKGKEYEKEIPDLNDKAHSFDLSKN